MGDLDANGFVGISDLNIVLGNWNQNVTPGDFLSGDPSADGFVTQDAELDEFGHVKLGGVGEIIAELIERRTGIETRVVTLGHLQRGGAPSAYDRVLGTRLGVHAARLAHEGRFGRMVSLRGTQITSVDLGEAVGEMRTLEPEFMDEAREFFT